MLHQVCPPTVQHPETQVLLKLGFDGHCVQLPGSEEAVVGPKEGGDGELGAAASPGTGPGRPQELGSTRRLCICFLCPRLLLRLQLKWGRLDPLPLIRAAASPLCSHSILS